MFVIESRELAAQRLLADRLPETIRPSPQDWERLETAALAERQYRDCGPLGKKAASRREYLDEAIAAVELLGNLGPPEANDAAWAWLVDLEHQRAELGQGRRCKPVRSPDLRSTAP